MKKIRDDFPDIAYFVFIVLILAAFVVGILAGQQTTEGAYRPALAAARGRAAELDRANTRLIGERNKLVVELAKRPFIIDMVEGEASWYGDRKHGRLTASGEIFDMHAMTAAHPTAPFGTVFVVVRINDRLPKKHGRLIDLAHEPARRLDMIEQGLARVRLFRVRPSDGD